MRIKSIYFNYCAGLTNTYAINEKPSLFQSKLLVYKILDG